MEYNKLGGSAMSVERRPPDRQGTLPAGARLVTG